MATATLKTPLLPSEILPVERIWSGPVPAVAPLRSILSPEPEVKVVAPTFKMAVSVEPYEAPGEIEPFAVTPPAAVPLPPRVAPVFTETADPESSEPFISSVPALIVVAPM